MPFERVMLIAKSESKGSKTPERRKPIAAVCTGQLAQMNRENQVARTEEHAENQRSDQEIVAFGYFFHNVISLIIQIRYFEILAKMSFFEVKKIPPDKNLKGRLSVLPPLFQQAIADLNSPRAAFFDKCNTLTL